MKTIFRLSLPAIIAVFCCSIGSAQIIYSNSFDGAAVPLNGLAPTVANSYAGGDAAATWRFICAGEDLNLLANGVISNSDRNTILLPFTPQAGHVYEMSASVSVVASGGAWLAMGFAQTGTTNLSQSTSRFTDNPPNGFDWQSFRVGGQCQLFAGAKTGNPTSGALNLMPTPGTYSVNVLLNTLSSPWSVASYINGVQVGTNFTYSANPPIAWAGICTQQGLPIGNKWFNDWTLTTSLEPFIIQQPTSPETVNGDATYTNRVTVLADPNGGPLTYQWYYNDVPLTNGDAITGADSNILSVSPILATNAGNYYVVVTNNYGSATSSVASVTVLTTPVITAPSNPTNAVTLFAGTTIGGTNYLGSSPTFSISASGAPPLMYQWQTNGVDVVGATNTTFTFTNCQVDSPTNIACVVTNVFGQATNNWVVTYIASPTAAYPQAVLASQPLDFWRLNEPDNQLNNGNANVVCHDYGSGNNGVYTNVTLGFQGYDASEPSETAAVFGPGGINNSFAGQIQGVDFAAPAGANAEFTVEAWVNGAGGAAGAPIITKGEYNVNDAFALNLDSVAQNYQFYVRTASGAVYKADSTVSGTDGLWHHVVGVCDEANSNVLLYIDGVLAAATNSPALAGAGEYEVAAPVSIGATTQAAGGGYSLQFFGYIDDAAAYSHALSAGEVAAHYAAPGNPVPVSVYPQPPANLVYLTGRTLSIPATVAGQPPFGYFWTNITTGALLASGQANAFQSLDATLTIPNAPASLSGDQLELIVTNGVNSINAFVALSSPPLPVTLDYSDPTLYSNNFDGGTWSIAGMPLTAANALVGGTNTAWVNALGTNDSGSLQANGVSATSAQDSWVLPFTPHAGYVYTVTSTLTFSGNPGTWVGLGFAQRVPTNAPVGYGRFSDGGTTPPKEGPNGYDWMILTESSGNVQYFGGPGGSAGITNKSPFFTAGVGTHTVQVVLDTTGTQWKAYGFVDGVPAGTNTYSSNPPIGAVGITQNNINPPGYVQWNSFAVTQVAPAGGVPPYAYNPALPTNVTLLADSALSISTSVFGSAPFGYYWSNTNTATVLGSGVSSSMTPVSADLSIANVPIGWNGNTLALTLTNAYGTNISFVTLTVTNTVNNIPTNIVATVTNNNLDLSWPADHTGWTLQAQTNTYPAGIGTNWVDITGSISTNQIIVPIDTTNGSVFYRLILK